MKCLREVEGDDYCQVIEPDRLAIPVVDLKCKEAGTVAGAGLAHRKAWACHIAAAVFDIPTFDRPLLAGDCPLLSRHATPRELFSLAARFTTNRCHLAPLGATEVIRSP